MAGSREEIYKEGTLRLANWLLRTANDCTDIIYLVAALEPKEDGVTVEAPQNLYVSTREYIKLATAISDAIDDGVHVHISDRVLHNIKRVIKLREELHAEYSARSMRIINDLTEHDRTHKHFIEVLNEAARKNDTENGWFRARVASSTETDSRLEEDEDKYEDNYDGDVDVLPCPLVTSCGGGRLTKTVDLSRTEVLLSKEASLLGLATESHLLKLHEVRASLRETWAQYQSGNIGRLEAEQTTIIAFALIRIFDNDFRLLHPELDDYGKLLQILGLSLVSSSGDPVAYLDNNTDGLQPSPRASTLRSPTELLCVSGALVNTRFQECLRRYLHNEARLGDGARLTTLKGPTQAETLSRSYHVYERPLGVLGH